MNANIKIIYDNVVLRPLSKTDLENLRIWRNDPKKNIFLKKIEHVSCEQQSKWYSEYIKNEFEIFFAIDENNSIKKHVGAISIYDINKNIASIGKMQIGDDNAHGLGIGYKAIVMLSKFAFETLMVEKLVSYVNKDNLPSLISFINAGFKIKGEKDSFSKYGGRDYILSINHDRLKCNFKEYNDIEVISLSLINYGYSK